MRLIQSALQSLPVITSIFTAAIGLTLHTAYREIEHYNADAAQALDRQQRTIGSAIDDKLHIYEQLLRSGAALFYSSEHVTRKEWQLFANTVQLNKHWPGVQGIGYTPFVDAANIREHEQTIRSQGYADYEVHPKGARDFYAPIIYLEPFDWRNQRALGYDMWSSPVRQTAMKLAMETGSTQASGVITLVQETQSDVQKGFLLYTPVYTKYEDTQEANPKITGWVYAPFRIEDFMGRLLPESNIALRIYDVTNPNQEAKLYQKDDQRIINSLISNSQYLDVFGRRWRIDHYAPPTHWPAIMSDASKLSLASSLALDIFLLLALLLFRHSERDRESTFQRRHATLINDLKIYNSEVHSQKKTISALEGEVHTLQTWLQEREARIKELKLEQDKSNFDNE